MESIAVSEQIRAGMEKAGKRYDFDDDHDPTRPASFRFHETRDGLTLYVIFYTQACRWSRCLGCNLPSRMSGLHVPYPMIMTQIDTLLSDPDISSRRKEIRNVIIGNNGSVLDHRTFPVTALMYLIARLKFVIPFLDILSLETRPEYTDFAVLEYVSRALREGQTKTRLELCIGFEAFDETIRNGTFDKGLTFDAFERFVRTLSPQRYQIGRAHV
jgi:radical SAM enzyme (TIGR01210 family)